MSPGPESDPSHELCGLSGWRPLLLQRLASKKAYTLLYSLVGVVQGMFFAYLSATLSTMERQFGIASKQTGYMMAGNEVSQIVLVLFLPAMVRLDRKALWTSAGLSCSALGCFVIALPKLLSPKAALGPGTAEGSQDPMLCLSGGGPSNRAAETDDEMCRDGVNSTSNNNNTLGNWSGPVLVFLGNALTGVGNCAFYTIGLAFLDDNVSHRSSPLLLGLTYALRLSGPMAGYLLASASLRSYVDPGVDPGFDDYFKGKFPDVFILGCCCCCCVNIQKRISHFFLKRLGVRPP